MSGNNWSAKEMEFSQQLKKIYDEDISEVPFPDTSFMKDNSVKKKSFPKLLHFGTIAAVIMLMAASSIVTAICISDGYVEAFKNEIAKKMFTWKSGITVTDDSTSVDEQSEIWEFSDSALIPELLEIFPEIKIPRYIPSGYEFETAIVEPLEDNDYIATFEYSNGADLLKIMQMPISEDTTAGISSHGEVIELSDRIVTVWKDFGTDIHAGAVIFEDASVLISASELSEEELLKIAKKLK